MKPPIKNLIGGVEESHTREYLFKISAQMMGCRERSKNRLQEQQEHKNKCRTRVFGEKERGRKKTYLEGAMWAPGALWARPGAGPRQLAAWATGGSPWLPPGPSRSLPTWKFLFKFFWNFSENFIVENFSKFKKLRNSLKT